MSRTTTDPPARRGIRSTFSRSPLFVVLLLGTIAPPAALQSQEIPTAVSGHEAAMMTGSPPWLHFGPVGFDQAHSFGNIAEDDEGRIYVLANQRIFVGTGSHWAALESIPPAAVHDLHISRHGLLFASLAHDFGFLDLNLEQPEWHSLRHNMPQDLRSRDNWHLLHEDAEGSVYIAIGPHLIAHHPRTPVRSWMNIGPVHDVFSLPGDRFAYTEGGLILRLEAAGRSRPVLQEVPNLHKTPQNSIPLAENGSVLIAGAHGLFRFDGSRILPWQAANPLLSPLSPTRLLRLDDGRILVQDKNRGLILLNDDGSGAVRLPQVGPLRTQHAGSLHLDRRGGLWLTHASGLYRAEILSGLELFDFNLGLDGQVHALVQHAEQAYVATSQGLYLWHPETEQAAAGFRRIEHIPVPEVLLSTPHGLVAGTREGAWIIDGRGGHRMASGERPRIFSSGRQEDQLLLATGDGVDVFRHDGTRWRPDPLTPRLSGRGAGAVLDAEGYLWIPQGAGRVQRHDPARLDAPPLQLGPDDGLPVDPAMRLWQVGDRLIAETGGNCLEYSAESQRFVRTESWTFLPHDANGMPTALRHESGELWLRASIGSHEFRPFFQEGFADVLTSSTLSSFGPTMLHHSDERGQRWIANRRGLFRLAPEIRDTPAQAALQSLVHRIHISGEEEAVFHSARGAPRVELGSLDLRRRTLQIEFSLLNFETRGSANFSTHLDGIEDSRQPANPATTRTLGSLPPGKYLLHIEARDAFGAEAEPAQVAFSVTRPFHTTVWAYTLYAAAGVLALLLAVGATQRRIILASRRVGQRANQLQRLADEQKTELAHREQQLGVALSRAEEYASSLDELQQLQIRFISELSLRLRPLVAGTRSLIRIQQEPAATYRRPVFERALELSGGGLARTIRCFLDPEPFATPPDKPLAEPFNLREIIEEGFASVAPYAGALGIELISQIQREVNLERTGDSQRLLQILTHFLCHAIEHCSGGEITLDVRRQSGKPVDHVEFELADNGPGLSPEVRQALMSHPNSDPARRHPAAPPGLIIARKLLETLRGDLKIESDPGHGTRFIFRLPLSHSNFPREVPHDFRNRRVLIIDENPHVLKTLQQVAEQWNMDAHVAYDGAQAFESLKESPPTELVWLDGDLGEEAGLQVLANMRATPEYAQLPVILLAPPLADPDFTPFVSDPHTLILAKPHRTTLLHEASARFLGVDIDALMEVEPAEPHTPDGEEPANRTGESSAEVPAQSTPPRSVIVADTHPSRRALLVSLLRQCGVETREAADATAAVAHVESAGCDLLLLVDDPKHLDAAAVADQIRRSLPSEEQPALVALTATKPDPARFGNLDDYLSLPLDPTALAERLRILS